jgi:hypothetical protein
MNVQLVGSVAVFCSQGLKVHSENKKQRGKAKMNEFSLEVEGRNLNYNINDHHLATWMAKAQKVGRKQ